MNYLHTALQWFNQLESKRKISLAGAMLFMVLMTAFLSWWTLSPSYAILFNNLDEQDANKVLSQLDQENISYQLRHGGGEILIDKNLVAKTRLKIMGSGLQLNGNVGFELFDKNDFGMTDFSQKINYQRALQGELERTITSLDEVKQARVHLVIPEKHLFAQDSNQPKAAVTLHLKSTINPKQVHSIQQLVASSVDHLSLKNVVVVDQNGNTLSPIDEDSSTNHFNAKKNIEHYLNDKITHILYKVFAKNQVVVKVNADINYDELQRELIKPQTKGQVTHEKEIKHSTLDKKGKQHGNQDLTVEKSYEFGREKELFKRASGTIERLTVSVVLPQSTDAKTIAQIQRLIKSTVGFNEKRGDVVSVEALISQPAVSVLPAPPAPTYSNLSAVPSKLDTADDPANKSRERYVDGGVLGLIFLIISSSAVLTLKRIRHKKRQQLLLELTQWLDQHE